MTEKQVDCTSGGGRAEHYGASSDYPIEALRRHRTEQSCGGPLDAPWVDGESKDDMTKQRLGMIAKNVQSLQTDQRLKEFFAELKQLTDWDVLS